MDGAYDAVDSSDPALVRVTAWAAHPFSSNMSALGWVLWLGLVLCGVVLWTRLLKHFED